MNTPLHAVGLSGLVTVPALFLAATALAGPLQQAEIHKIVNDVRIVDAQGSARTATVRDVIKDDVSVRTGVQSRAELLFQDNTLTRLGADALFSFKPGTRDMTLDRGSMLLQVPKGLGGARIRAAAVTAAITGTTIMMENQPGNHVKVLVLEGSLRLSLNGWFGESVVVTPGKMVILGAKDRHMPKPVSVDLAKLVKTAALIDPVKFSGGTKTKVEPLPSIGLIEKEMAVQAGAKERSQLAETNLLIQGNGTQVVMASKDTMAALDAAMEVNAEKAPVLMVMDKRGAQPLEEPSVTANPVSSGGATTADTSSVPPAPATPAVPVAPPRALPPPAAIPLPPPPITTPPPVAAPAPIDPLTSAGFLPPDWTAIATTPPFAPVNTPPATISLASGLIFGGPGNAATFDLTGPFPQLTLGTRSLAGGLYGGAALDGSAAMFAFGSVQDFDVQTKFDSRFGMGGESAFPSNGVAMFRFVDDLTLGGNPSFTTGPGLRDLALVVGRNVSTSVAGGALDLSALHSLTIATANGGITFGSNMPVSSAGGSGFKFLHLYASGLNGYVALHNAVNLPGAGLFIDAQKDILVSPFSNVAVDHAAFNADGNIFILGTLTADTLRFNAGNTMSLSNVTTARRVSIAAGSFFMSLGTLNATDLSIVTTGDIGPGFFSVIKADVLSLKAGNVLNLNTSNPLATRLDLSTATQFQAEGNEVRLGSDIILSGTTFGTIKAGSNGLKGSSFCLRGFDSVESGGKIDVFDLDTRSLKAAGNVTVNGNSRVTDADVGGWFYTAGTISPRVGTAVTTLHVLKADSVQALGGMNFKGANGSLVTAPSAGHQAYLDVTSAQFSNNPGNGINGANFDGGDALPATLDEGGDGGTLSVGSNVKPVASTIDISRPITATTGSNGSGVATGGRGGTVNLVANGTITVGSTVKVSDSAAGKASKQGGNIRIDSRRTSGSAIRVTNSGQLLSLLAAAAPGPGGKVEFVSSGGDISVDGGTVRADRGTVDIRNNGPSGLIQLINANVSADVVKVGALGANGQLRIGGGTINADTSLKLYGGTSNGEVRFTDNVTLGGNSTKIIAGKTVQIDNGKTVTIGGSSSASVYTDNANYSGSGGNGSKTGTFGGNGATKSSFGSAPSF